MNNLKDLFDNKEYKKIIDITKDKTNEESLSFRLSSLISLNRYKDAISFLSKKDIHDILYKKNPLLTMKTYINLLIHERQIDRALKTLEMYENMPYVSQQAEEFMKEAKADILSFLNPKEDKTMSKEEIISAFESSKNNENLTLLIYSLRKKNIKPYIAAIEKLLVRDDINDDTKTLALILLVDNKYPFKVHLIKNKKDYYVVPNDIESPFINKDFDNFLDLVNKNNKNPSLNNIINNLLSNLLISLFPENIFDVDVNLIYQALYIIACEYLKIEFTPIFKNKNEEEKVINLVNKYKEILK